ncbi:MAG: hypothetical protein DWQ05_18930 [Calditrichaeota bacterium]|nr:MAG: hypothetical protein DWQ05_18930 [Calditrichota bacterium]
MQCAAIHLRIFKRPCLSKNSSCRYGRFFFARSHKTIAKIACRFFTTSYFIPADLSTFKIFHTSPMLENMILLNHKECTAIEIHAEKTYPYECCGFLLGMRRGEDDFVVSEIIPAENQCKPAPGKQFKIHAGDFFNVQKYSKKKDSAVIGIYHSHPDSPALPSKKDLAAAWPGFINAICAVRRGLAIDTQIFKLSKDRTSFEPIKMKIVEPV